MQVTVPESSPFPDLSRRYLLLAVRRPWNLFSFIILKSRLEAALTLSYPLAVQ